MKKPPTEKELWKADEDGLPARELRLVNPKYGKKKGAA